MQSQLPKARTPWLMRSPRRGQALVEFAIIAFVLTLLLGAMLTFGFLLFGANVLQQAADVGAQELARHPFSPTGTFEEAVSDSGLFDEAALVIPANTDPNTLPLINRLLFPLYIYDVDIDQLRYPGALVRNTDTNQLTVLIPIVGFGNRDPVTGVETITEWRRVVEEIVPAGELQGPYSLAATDTQRGSLDEGMVALRISYPHQSGALVAYLQTDGNGNAVPPAETLGRDDLVNIPVQADDASVTHDMLPDGYTLESLTPNSVVDGSPNRGEFGLGEMQALGTTVRPYRKVLTAQAIYRREVFK
jgi:hypothetical protein